MNTTRNDYVWFMRDANESIIGSSVDNACVPRDAFNDEGPDLRIWKAFEYLFHTDPTADRYEVEGYVLTHERHSTTPYTKMTNTHDRVRRILERVATSVATGPSQDIQNVYQKGCDDILALFTTPAPGEPGVGVNERRCKTCVHLLTRERQASPRDWFVFHTCNHPDKRIGNAQTLIDPDTYYCALHTTTTTPTGAHDE